MSFPIVRGIGKKAAVKVYSPPDFRIELVEH
jgi:hypothetical protein